MGRPADADTDEIHAKAIECLGRFRRSGNREAGIKRDVGEGVKGRGHREQIHQIVSRVERLDTIQQQLVLNELRVRPIWYEDHAEIPEIVNRILE